MGPNVEIRFEARDSDLPPPLPNVTTALRWQNPLTLHTTTESRFFALAAVAVNIATGAVSRPRIIKFRVANDYCRSSELPSAQPCQAETTLAADVSAAALLPGEVDVTMDS